MAQILLFCFAGRISAMYGKQVMAMLNSTRNNPPIQHLYRLPDMAMIYEL
ncbi:MAG: hypothetical protein JRI92_13565 [Deltaproteobacteria bacterium]|nr:hypothetical protein [Deltaproteobacteria bacterium]